MQPALAPFAITPTARVCARRLAAAATLGLAAALAAPAAQAAAVVINSPSFFGGRAADIDFDTLPGGGATVAGALLDAQYAGLGVRFASEDEPDTLQSTDLADSSGRFGFSMRLLAAVGGGGVPTSGSRYASGRFFTGMGVSDLRIDFTDPVQAFGMQVIDNDFSTARLQAFDEAGLLLGSVTVPQVGEGGTAFWGLDVGGGSRVRYVILDGAGGAQLDSTFIDDLYFTRATTPGALPVPGTAALVALGLVALTARRPTTAEAPCGRSAGR